MNSCMFCSFFSNYIFTDDFYAGVPDFAEVYSFIGSVFDPESRLDHVEKLKEMDPLNFETVSQSL